MNATPRFAPGVVHAAADDEGGGLGSLGVALIMVFLFLSYSRTTDFVLPSLRITLVIALLALVVTAATGGLQRALTSQAGLWLSAFSVWLVVDVPFSFWKGGSVALLMDRWSKSYLAFVIVAGLLRSVRHCRLAMYSIAFATLVIVGMSLVFGVSPDGRLALETGLLSNANNLAQLLLIGMPFLLFVAMSRKRALLKRPVVAACIIASLLITGQTASRGALMAVVCLIVSLFFSFSWRNKLKLIAAFALTAAVVLPLISSEQRSRYLTIIDPGSEETLNAGQLSAVESREQRLDLLRQSVDLTLSHPIFGVGPGMFQAAQGHQDDYGGLQDALWRETHNTYTQVSSEAGLPAFVFYVAALITCFRFNRLVYVDARKRNDGDEMGNMAYCLWLSLIAFAVTAFFSSGAYELFFPMLAGLTVAVHRIAVQDTEAADAAVRDVRISVPSPGRVSGAWSREKGLPAR